MELQSLRTMNFTDLVDIAELRALCASFTALTGAVTAILDLEGNVLVATGWQTICTHFHRVNPATAQRCRESDTVLAGQLKRGESYNVYRCRNGLVDVAVPIRIGGQHVANFFTGQFFFEEPDRAAFERQAKTFGFDTGPYLAALDQTPVFTEARIRQMMDFLVRLAVLIGEMGLTRLRLEAANQQLARHHEHLEELVSQRTLELTQAKDQAETANRAKSAFLANMSHELKTPLNVITLGTYLLKHSGVNPEQTRQLDRIDAAGSRLLEVIDSVFELTKLEAGNVSLTNLPFRPTDTFANVADLLHAKARGKGLLVQLDSSALCGLELLGDTERLRQALSYLADNAVKFTESGTINFRAAIEQESSRSITLRFEVEDTGIGIAPDQLGQLFAPFQQVDDSSTRRYGGAGLGLTIAQRIAHMMDGQVGVQSRLGFGSVFHLSARFTRAPLKRELKSGS